MVEATTVKDLEAIAEARFQRSIDEPLSFFEREAEKVSRACLAMARRFHRGGRLLAFGAGNAVTDAQHVSVEFVHPVIMGKRALPAVALGTDIAATVGLATTVDWSAAYARQVAAIACPEDIAVGIDPSGDDAAVIAGLEEAVAGDLLTIGLTGADGGRLARMNLDYCFVVPGNDAALIQEIHETLYHILWELVHVFFEHKGLLQ